MCTWRHSPSTNEEPKLGVASFAATAAGYRELLDWLEGFGTLELVGIEGTGSYGAGLTCHLLGHQIAVVEVDRPNRQRRRRNGQVRSPRRRGCGPGRPRR